MEIFRFLIYFGMSRIVHKKDLELISEVYNYDIYLVVKKECLSEELPTEQKELIMFMQRNIDMFEEEKKEKAGKAEFREIVRKKINILYDKRNDVYFEEKIYEYQPRIYGARSVIYRHLSESKLLKEYSFHKAGWYSFV